MNKNQIILTTLLIFLIFVWCFVYWSNYLAEPSRSGTLTEETDLCARFSEVEDTVSCKTARTSVLEKYPGEIKYIRRTKAELPTGILPDVEMVEKDVWLFGINLTEPVEPVETDEIELNSVEIFITRDGGELIIKSMASGTI